jgi:hypothetical protein
MNNKLVTPLILFLGACADDIALSYQCDMACALDDTGKILLADDAYAVTCNVGKLVCSDDGTRTCEGFIPFGPETCEDGGIDRDCSGDPDNIFIPYFTEENDCIDTQQGICKWADKVCVNDSWTCRPPDFLPFGQEVCDSVDNDCDGLTDSADPDLNLGDEFVYEGDPSTLNVGECRAGVRECSRGSIVLRGQTLPTLEVCGNDDDDDCDGSTDELENSNIRQDFLIVLDFSGSMAGTIITVKDALCDWAEGELLQNSRFAIVGVGVSRETFDDVQIDLVTDFSTAANACLTLNTYIDYVNFFNISEPTHAGSAEYVAYAILESQENMGLDWSGDNSKKIVFFTDEAPQGFGMTVAEQLTQVREDCSARDYMVGGFVTDYEDSWRPTTDACFGFIEQFDYNEDEEIRQQLDYRFGLDCGVQRD